MAKALSILDYLKKNGFGFYSGVPCSLLKQMLWAINDDKEIEYVTAVRENAALGVASGAYLAGKRPCILIQNSGIGNIVNALTSFNLIYKIPVLMLISWRGFEGKDAPEHIIMGEKTMPILKELGIPNGVMTEDYGKDISWAMEKMRAESIPVALIVKEGLIQ